MKQLNPMASVIDQAIKLYFELCRTADDLYEMGPHSGVKRTILLLLLQRGEMSTEQVHGEYPDPTLGTQGMRIIMEMASSGWISTELRADQQMLTLTEAGHEKALAIIALEAKVAFRLPRDLSFPELRKTERALSTLREALKDLDQIQDQDQPRMAVG